MLLPEIELKLALILSISVPLRSLWLMRIYPPSKQTIGGEPVAAVDDEHGTVDKARRI